MLTEQKYIYIFLAEEEKGKAEAKNKPAKDEKLKIVPKFHDTQKSSELHQLLF